MNLTLYKKNGNPQPPSRMAAYYPWENLTISLPLSYKNQPHILPQSNNKITNLSDALQLGTQQVGIFRFVSTNRMFPCF